jgi:hypothetical protein
VVAQAIAEHANDWGLIAEARPVFVLPLPYRHVSVTVFWPRPVLVNDATPLATVGSDQNRN